MSLAELAGRILAREGRSADQPVGFHIAPSEPVPVAGMKGVEIRYLIIGRYGPVEMLPAGIYVETNIPPARYRPSPNGTSDTIKEALKRHINAGPKDRDRLSLINPCFTPRGYWMFKVATLPTEAPSLQGEAL